MSKKGNSKLLIKYNSMTKALITFNKKIARNDETIIYEYSDLLHQNIINMSIPFNSALQQNDDLLLSVITRSIFEAYIKIPKSTNNDQDLEMLKDYQEINHYKRRKRIPSSKKLNKLIEGMSSKCTTKKLITKKFDTESVNFYEHLYGYLSAITHHEFHIIKNSFCREQFYKFTLPKDIKVFCIYFHMIALRISIQSLQNQCILPQGQMKHYANVEDKANKLITHIKQYYLLRQKAA